MLVLSIAAGVAEQLFAEDQRSVMFAVGIAGLLLLGSWVRLDANERGYTLTKPLFLAIILMAVLGLPVYFIRTRGTRGVVSILIASLFAFALMGIEQIAIEITFYLM